jgi:hypothetical protein
MEQEEKNNIFQDMLDWLEERGRIALDFRKKLSEQLFKLILFSRPDIKKYKEQISERLQQLVSEYTEETFECYNSAGLMSLSKKDRGPVPPVPKIKTRSESEKELKKDIIDIPDSRKELYIKSHWEVYKYDKIHEKFVQKIYRKMKEVMVEFYADDIMRYEGNCIRSLDFDLYYYAASPFVQEIYKIESDIEDGKYSRLLTNENQ